MDELCETLDARAAARAGAGTSDEMTTDMAATPPEESEEVREQHRRLLAEIRSCFRLLSIHSRLSGSESPRTRRISTQTDSCESLHSLAAGRAKGSTRVLRGLSPTEDAQNSLLYNQLIIESTPSVSDVPCNSPPSTRTAGTSTAGLSPHLDPDLDQRGGGGDEVTEPTGESIHQRAVVNPTSSLKMAMDLSKADVINVVEWLYRDHPGAVWRAASRKAMEDQVDSRYLTYGEVSFIAFTNLLEKYAPSRPVSGSSFSANQERGNVLVSNASSSSQQDNLLPGGFTFYDLGCGAGRPVYMASLMNTNCTKSCGIEIVPNMHEMNKVLLRLYKLEVQPNLHPRKQSQQLDFLIGDFLQIDWSDADIIFTNATCFPEPVFRKFEVKDISKSLAAGISTCVWMQGMTLREMAAKVLKTGAIVISVTRPFDNLETWELLERQERQMSWAPASVYVYRKQGPSHPELDRPSTSAVPESELVPEQASNTEDHPQTHPAGACDKGS